MIGQVHDPIWVQGLLGLHVAAGVTAFLFAPLALITRKGGKAHRRWGKVYFWAMAVVASSAVILSAYRPILFLALVAVFSFYAAFFAYRTLYLKQLGRGVSASWIDWAAASFTFAASLMLCLCGLLRPSVVQNMGAVSIVFGLLGMTLATGRIVKFLRPPTDRMFWWFEHISGMLGSYIAAWTAFSAVTLGRYLGSTWYVWLWPTMIGVPAIVLTSAYYHRKFDKRKAPVAAV